MSEQCERAGNGRSCQFAVVAEDLAELEQATGRYTEAAALYRRVIDQREHEFRDDGALANSLEHYASLLKQTGRSTDAANIEARAKEIRVRLSGAVVK